MVPLAEHFAILKETVARAVANSAYYSETLGNRPLQAWSDFARFPVLSREVLVANLDAIRVAGVPVHFINTTAGTSSRSGLSTVPLIQLKSESEREAYRFILERGFHNSSDQSSLILQLVTGEHGQDMAAGVSGILTVPLQRAHHVPGIFRLLDMGFAWGGTERKIRVLTGSCYVLKCLTIAALELGIKPRHSEVNMLVSKGEALTSRWKRLLGRVWGAAVQDVYGLSEVAGFNCTTCPRCGGFRPSKTALTEFLELGSNEQALSGLARLVTTSFYPLSEVMPLIRYDTGDVGYLDPMRPIECETCFTLLGRYLDLRFFTAPSGARCVVSPLVINDLLDSLPETVRSEEQPLSSQLGIRPDLGNPRFKIQRTSTGDRATTVQILVETRATLHRGDSQGFYRNREALNKMMRMAIFPPEERKSICINLEPVPPGTLDGY